MSIQMIGAYLSLIIFILILTNQRISNWVIYVVIAPIVVATGLLTSSDVFGSMTGSSIQMMMIICIFSGLIASCGLDVVIGDTVDRLTSFADGKKKESLILAMLFTLSGFMSFFLQNTYVALAFLPIMKSIAYKNHISLSKMILFVIYSSTLGGTCTLLGCPANIYANTALMDAGLESLAIFDFSWIGIPVFILGGLYMVLMNHWCASYDDFGDDSERKSGRKEDRKKQIAVGISFGLFILSLIADSLITLPVGPIFIGYALIAICVISDLFTPKEAMSSLNIELVLFCAGINLVILVMKASGIGDMVGNAMLSILGDTKNLYVITAVLFLGSALMTQFMNNMATTGVLCPIGISIANALGANPQAIVLAIALGANCSYLTPIASGTNQTMMVFSKLKFTDFIKFGWPLVVISFVGCVTILPAVFPFF